jgi:uncharacterized protein (DUF2267 family)/CBS domain-containing protein
VRRLLVTVLLGQNIVNTLGAAVASALFVRYLGDSWGIVAATVVMTIVTFLFGEVGPKAFAAAHPKRVAYLVALPLYLLHQVLRPLHILYDRIIDPLIERLAGGPDTAPQMSSVEELMRLARGPEAQTSVGDRPIGIIAAAARAVDMTVADIMVPRTEVVAYSVDTPPVDLLKGVLEEGYTRVPIYEGTIDRVLGVAHLKDLVELVRDSKADLRRILRPVRRSRAQAHPRALTGERLRPLRHRQGQFSITLGHVTRRTSSRARRDPRRVRSRRLLTIREVAPGALPGARPREGARLIARRAGRCRPSPPTRSPTVFNTLGARRGRVDPLRGTGRRPDLSRNVSQVQIIEKPARPAAPATDSRFASTRERRKALHCAVQGGVMNHRAFFREVAGRLRCDERRAEAITFVVFQELRARITPKESGNVAAQLPTELKRLWLENERTDRGVERMHLPEFIGRFASTPRCPTTTRRNAARAPCSPSSSTCSAARPVSGRGGRLLGRCRRTQTPMARRQSRLTWTGFNLEHFAFSSRRLWP